MAMSYGICFDFDEELVERLQDITKADDSAEGCRVCNATGEYDGAGCPECSGKGFITNYGQVIHERSEESQ